MWCIYVDSTFLCLFKLLSCSLSFLMVIEIDWHSLTNLAILNLLHDLVLKKLPLTLGMIVFSICFKCFSRNLYVFLSLLKIIFSTWFFICIIWCVRKCFFGCPMIYLGYASHFQWRLDNIWNSCGIGSPTLGNCGGRTSFSGSWIWWLCCFEWQWSLILPCGCPNCKPINFESFTKRLSFSRLTQIPL